MSEELSFQGGVTDKLPPQNIEVEEAVLGGILLDPEAIGRINDRLVTEAFYISAHRDIYQAALRLHGQGKPTDFLNIVSWLNDNDLLNRVGGRNKLVSLLERTVSAVNIDALAQVVMDKYQRRKLIKAGNEIVQLGYETETELTQVLDKAEQKVFGIAQERSQSGLVHIGDSLISNFSDIEQRNQGIALPGISCGFYDLDALVNGGFQRSDMIIVAGRPAMGKCVAFDTEILLANGSVTAIEEIYKNRQAQLLSLGNDWRFYQTQPSAYVDDGIKPVFRVTTGLGKYVETTITHPYLTVNGWRKLSELKVGDKIAVPRKLEVFGTEIMRDSEIKILAYLIGDGCLTHISPQFTNKSPLLQEDFSQAVTNFVGMKVRLETSNGTRAPTLYVTGNSEFLAAQRKIFAQLKTAIKSQNIPARELSQILKVSPALVCNWQKGKCVPSAETFKLLCETLQILPEKLASIGLNAISNNSSNSLTLWLRELGIWGKDAHAKTIPGVIFKLTRSQIALFLNRLFATDGWASVLKTGQVQLGYGTVSEKLARQVQHLLLRFGIIATLKERSVKYKDARRKAWQLDIIDAYSIKTFVSEIGIFGKEKAISQVELTLEGMYQTNYDTIPIEWEQLAAAKGSEPWSILARRAGIEAYSNIHVGKRTLSRERLWILASALENLPLQQLADSDIYWDKIVSIESVGEKQVYDLTIPNTHNFIANDICVHNTSFAINIAHYIAGSMRMPVAIFSLEMSKEQLALRMLSSEARIESNYLRSGRISQNQWEDLTRGISTLQDMPIYIDDTPNITIGEMRSQARRLQAEKGVDLGLVLIDYLQLMEGGGDNRVQELSKITRQIKGLARELNVPVLALSQLSRGVESRTNKRPMLSDLRESGCLTGDSLVTMADSGIQIPIRELVGKSGFAVWALNEGTMQLERAIVSNAFSTGVKPVFTLRTRLGRTIRATGNHKFLTIQGWCRLDELSPKQHLCLSRYLPSSIEQTRVLQSCIETSYCGSTLYKANLSRKRALKVSNVVQSDELLALANSDVYWDEIVSIEYSGEEEVFDLTVPGPHNFVVNNIVAHNSIEQDADLVLMLYRDEYYSPDTPERGIAEIIIAKHRHGPTGIVKLLFDPQFTQFKNLARPNY